MFYADLVEVNKNMCYDVILISPLSIYLLQIKLKRVLGLTVCSNAALDVSPVSGLLAYPAG